MKRGSHNSYSFYVLKDRQMLFATDPEFLSRGRDLWEVYRELIARFPKSEGFEVQALKTHQLIQIMSEKELCEQMETYRQDELPNGYLVSTILKYHGNEDTPAEWETAVFPQHGVATEKIGSSTFEKAKAIHEAAVRKWGGER